MNILEHRRCWVEVDGRPLRHNFRILRGLVPRATRFMAVVKANAYGHGLVPMAQELEAIGTDWLGVANVAEAAVIRQAGVRLPIQLLSATLPEEMEEAVRLKLTLTLSSYEEGRRLDRVARALGKKAEVHFKVDTGMGRLGCWYAQAREELARIRRLPHLVVKGICTHFASADDNAGLTRTQWDAIAPLFEENKDLLRHAANSPAVTRRYGFNADMVRVGLALYGIPPNPEDQALGLRPRDPAARNGAGSHGELRRDLPRAVAAKAGHCGHGLRRRLFSASLQRERPARARPALPDPRPGDDGSDHHRRVAGAGLPRGRRSGGVGPAGRRGNPDARTGDAGAYHPVGNPDQHRRARAAIL
jgi:alanine racemase